MNGAALSDKRVSTFAKGLLAVMVSRPDNWSFSVKGLATILPEGEKAIRSGLQELEQTGYIRRQKQGRKGAGRFAPIQWDVADRPIFSPDDPSRDAVSGKAATATRWTECGGRDVSK